jgi:zinc and cadmium transporter
MFTALVSVLIVSLISFIGIFSFFLKEGKLEQVLFFLVSFSAGGLFGGTFFHLLPESIEQIGFDEKIAFYLLSGLLTFFILEKFIRWRHCHIPTSDKHPHPLGYMNLIGDAIHNFIDGIIIAAAYLTNLPLGMVTTLAIIFHEVPQEISDFGVLIYAGFSKTRALFFNFLSALFAIFGCLLIFLFGRLISNLVLFLIPFAAGGFIYIAGSDLIPELHKEMSIKRSFFQFLTLVAGLLMMYLLKFIH